MTDQRKNRWRDNERVGTEQRGQGAEQHEKVIRRSSRCKRGTGQRRQERHGQQQSRQRDRAAQSRQRERGTEQRGQWGQSIEED